LDVIAEKIIKRDISILCYFVDLTKQHDYETFIFTNLFGYEYDKFCYKAAYD